MRVMKNYQKVFHPKGIIYVVMTMIMVIVGMAVLVSLASCSQEPVHEHSWGDGVVTKAATCTEAGEKTYTCECGETKTEVIPALGHSWNEGVVTEEPAFMHSGEMLFTCTVCGEEETRVIERGDGTKDNPYLITSEEDWNAFADYMLGHTNTNTFSGKYFKLTADISVSRMAGAYIGESSFTPFRGKFDGDGHTITLTLNSSDFEGGTQTYNKGLALFMTATNGCEIRNLHVTGTITTDRMFAAGFISYVNGATGSNPNNVVVLENCRSSVTIISSVDGDATSAGFVAIGRNRLDLTLKNCLFDGNFISEAGTNFSGLIGYHYNITSNPCILTISDCAVILGDETSERLKTEAGSMTFVRHADSLVPVFEGNVFYSTVLGKQDAFGAATKAYLSQADATVAPENVCGTVKTATIAGQNLYYVGDTNHAYNLNEGIITVEPAFMRNGVKTYTCTTCGITKEEITEDRGNGTKENPYLITSEEDWNAFAVYTQSSNCSGTYFKLTDDISVSKMANACTTDTLPMFRGKLDGDGHTITLTLSSTEFAGGSKEWNKGLALFMTATNGCEIRNLHVDGTITTDRKFAAGFIAYVNGAVNEDPNNVVVLENCRSSVKIISSVAGDATSAGFVAIGRNRLDLTLKNCLFDGNFISEAGTNFSGLIGYHHNITSNPCILTISDCAVILGDETSERLKTEAGSMTFIRHADSLVPVFEGNILYTSVLGGNQDAGEAASPAYLSLADAVEAAGAANKEVGTKVIAGQTLYYLAEPAE